MKKSKKGLAASVVACTLALTIGLVACAPDTNGGEGSGEGDAQAAEIYANSYSVDPDFYYFWRSLQALEEALGTNSTLVLDENSPLFTELVKHIAP